jgi:hypothetical protein
MVHLGKGEPSPHPAVLVLGLKPHLGGSFASCAPNTLPLTGKKKPLYLHLPRVFGFWGKEEIFGGRVKELVLNGVERLRRKIKSAEPEDKY